MSKVISKNKDAFFNYEILDKYEAGIQLKGWEIKSIREGNISLKGSFCSFNKNELFVSNMHISLYMNIPGDETSPRKLLLNKNEIKKIQNAIQAKGLTVVPLTLKLSNKGLAKLDIAIGKGKTKFDKREVIKKRDQERINKNHYKGM